MTKDVVTETRTIYEFSKDEVKEILCRKARVKVEDIFDFTLDDEGFARIVSYKRISK